VWNETSTQCKLYGFQPAISVLLFDILKLERKPPQWVRAEGQLPVLGGANLPEDRAACFRFHSIRVIMPIRGSPLSIRPNSRGFAAKFPSQSMLKTQNHFGTKNKNLKTGFLSISHLQGQFWDDRPKTAVES
jgi:hypothetical protein